MGGSEREREGIGQGGKYNYAAKNVVERGRRESFHLLG